MGLSCLFEYRFEKSGFMVDLGLRCIFYLLHSLVPIFRKSRWDYKNISNRRLVLVGDDGAYYALVLDEFKVGR